MKRTLPAVLLLFLLLPGLAWSATLVVIVSADSPIETVVVDDLVRIFMGGEEYLGETRIYPVTLEEGSDLRAEFLRSVLHTTNSRYKSNWIKQIFRAGKRPPKQVESIAEMVQYISQDHHAIGYIYSPSEIDTRGVREVYRKEM